MTIRFHPIIHLLSTRVFYAFIVVCFGSCASPFGILQQQHILTDLQSVCHKNDVTLEEAERTLGNFIANGRSLTTTSSSYDVDDTFHIHGWKWHTMSLAHEARRLNSLALKLRDVPLPTQQQVDDEMTDLSALRTVADYTIGFNMRGLHRIENEIFFPLVRQKALSVSERDVVTAFVTVLNQLDKDRSTVKALGTSLVSSFRLNTRR
jgi:hypothetical protein